MRTVVAPLVVKTDTRLHTFRQAKPESKRATSADGDRIVRIRFGIELLSKPFIHTKRRRKPPDRGIVLSCLAESRSADFANQNPHAVRSLAFGGRTRCIETPRRFFPPGRLRKIQFLFRAFLESGNQL